jgi:putative phosphoribosyl transferase
MKTALHPVQQNDLSINIAGVNLRGDLLVPDGAIGLVIFAHGSGSGRKSSRNRLVAQLLQQQRLGTLLFDLLTLDEEQIDAHTAHLRFDIPLLASRLAAVTRWVIEGHGEIPIGLFGSSTGAAAALIAAAELGGSVRAVVSRGGRPDLAGAALMEVTAPTLLIVGVDDLPVLSLNQRALAQLRCVKHMEVVPGASHLFEEPGKLEAVAAVAGGWFTRHLSGVISSAAHL